MILDWFYFGKHVTAATTENTPQGKQDVVITQPAPLPPDIPLLIGDVVHNLRCALDHVVCQLAIAAGNGTACRKTQFPIFITGSSAAIKTIDRYLRFVDPKAATAIKDLQPYKRRPTEPSSDEMWLISELDNIDKHRVLVVTEQHVSHTVRRVSVDGVTTILRQTEARSREKDSAQLFTSEFNRPNRTVHVDRQAQFAVVFKNTGQPCDGERVLPTLKRLVRRVSGLVDDFEFRFFEANGRTPLPR